MEHYSTFQHLDPHAIVMGVVYCLVALVVAGAAVAKLFRSF